MPTAKIVRTSFVAGELEPGLWGRTDQQALLHGAARLENLIPRRQGGARKRAGTELVDAFKAAESGAYEMRVIPFFYDRENFGLLYLYRANGSAILGDAFRAFYADGRKSEVTSSSIPGTFHVPAGTALSEIRHEQIGDTLFLSLRGQRLLTCAVTFGAPGEQAPALEWALREAEITVAPAPTPTATPSGFNHGDGYQGSTRTYRLWPVKDNTYGTPREVKANITLPWVSGATITVSFPTNYGEHDYYVLGKMLGSQFGEVARFYPDARQCLVSDLEWTALQTVERYTQNGTTYVFQGTEADKITAWNTLDPNYKGGSQIHARGCFLQQATFRHKSSSPPQVTGLRIWFGCDARLQENPDTSDQVSRVNPIDIVLANDASGTAWTRIASGITPNYSKSAVTVSFDTSISASSFHLKFTEVGDPSSLVTVPIRAVLVTFANTHETFIDDNISPGTVISGQDLLTTGDSGMDTGLVTTWQQRLVLASSNNSPFTLWFSRVGDLYNFYASRPQVSDDPFEATIATTKAARINHIVSQKWLLAFTDAGEFVIGATGGTLAFNTINVQQSSSVCAHPTITPVVTENSVIFAATDARSVYGMRYSLEQDSVVPTCLSTRAAHLTEGARLVRLSYQRHPDSILWGLLSDGTLVSMTYDENEGVTAWARHRIAGDTPLKVVDIFATGSIRSQEGTETTSDILLVLRSDQEADGARVWVERLRACVVADTVSTEAASCLDHYGYAQADYPAGASNPAQKVEATLETLRLEPPGADTLGVNGAAYDVHLRVRRAGALSVRPVNESLPVTGRESPWRTSATQNTRRPVVDEARGTVALVSGDVTILPAVVQGREPRLEIKSEDCWPCEILSMATRITYGTARNSGV